jgi:hypothetical protein
VIQWWVVLAVWLFLVGVAALRDQGVWNALHIVVCAAAALPLLPVVWLLTRLDVGAVPLDPRALERFAGMRTVDKTPAFCFFAWKRGVIFLRRWEVGSHLGKVELRVRDDDPLIDTEVKR